MAEPVRCHWSRSHPCVDSFLVGCFVFASALAGCAHVRQDEVLIARVDALIGPLVDGHEFSGAVVLARQGKVVYQRGFGMANRASGHSFTPRTAGDGGSLAKTFTAAGVWSLSHEGRIDLDAPVARYVAEFPHAATTVRQLISHSNGLPWDCTWFDPHFRKNELRTTQAMLKVLALHAPSPALSRDGARRAQFWHRRYACAGSRCESRRSGRRRARRGCGRTCVDPRRNRQHRLERGGRPRTFASGIDEHFRTHQESHGRVTRASA